jgi:hypothetical protein
VGPDIRLALALSSIFWTACNSAAIPPSRIAIGGGVSVDDVRPTDPAIDLRWSVHPLGLVEHVRSRRVDVGMGYGTTISSITAYGPELFGEYFFLPGPASGRGWRVGVLGSAQVLSMKTDEQRARGFGGSLGLDLEHIGFTSNDDQDGVLGEWALGAYTTARYGEADGLRCWSFVGGFEARMPLAVQP